MTEIMDFWHRLDLALVLNRRESLKEVCKKAGVVYQTVINQKCLKKYPSVEIVKKLGKELGCSLDWLILGVDSSKRNKG